MFFSCRDAETNAEKQKNKPIPASKCSFFYPAGRLPLASEFNTELAPSFQERRLLKAAKLEAVLTAQNDIKVIMAHGFEPN